jgi:hypothetical protein
MQKEKKIEVTCAILSIYSLSGYNKYRFAYGWYSYPSQKEILSISLF